MKTSHNFIKFILLAFYLIILSAIFAQPPCDIGFDPPNYEVSPASSPSESDGSIMVFASSGSGDIFIEYVVIPTNPPGSPIIQYEPLFTDLPGGEYSIEIIDAENPLCSGGILAATINIEESYILEPFPSYTGPLYIGDPLTLIANPPDGGPYFFHWTGPNGFNAFEENPLVGLADQSNAGTYTVFMFDENDNMTSCDINVEVVDEEVGTQYDDLSMNYDTYPFESCCICCEDEEESSFDVMPPPQMIIDLSKPAKLTKPNVEGPPSCECEFNSYTGNFLVQIPIFGISGLGPELSLDFFYNSCNSGKNYGYGNGWTFNYNLLWEKVGSNIHLHRGDGREDIFEFNSGDYHSPKGISDTLIDIGDKQFLLRSKYGMEYIFADTTHKRLTKVKDRNNNEITISFTDSLATSITGACGRSYQLEYTDGLLTVIKDNNITPSRTVHFEHDVNRNLRKIKDPLGHSRKYIYDIDRKIIQMADRRSNIVNVKYNEAHAVTEIQSSITEINATYDLANNQTIIAQPVGDSTETTTYTFDTEGRVVQVSGNCCGYNVQYEYNAENDIARITDALGQEYTYTYDGNGNVLTETDPLSNIQEFQYEPMFNQLAYWKDKNDNTSSCTFDTSGNVTSITFPSPGITLYYTYYDNGLLKSSTNGEGHTTNLAYNQYGNRTSIAYPIGTENFSYDGIGNQISSVTPNGETTLMEYNATRLPIKTTDPLSNSHESKYDPNGNEIWTLNKRGFITTRIFDAHNRMLKITKPQETITQYAYDEKGNQISRIDPNGNETKYTYGLRNLMTSETNALGNTQSWEYDLNGNLIKETNLRGYSTTYTFDELNRRTSKTDALGNTTTYQFDAKGNNTAVISPYGLTSTFQYNTMDKLVNTQHAYDQSTKTYDKNGNLIKEQDALGNTTNYEYDANDRLIKTTDALGQEMTYQYDDNGNTIATTDKMGNTSLAIFDAMDRAIVLINALGDSTIMSYDENSNQKTMTNGRGFTTEYSYNKLDRNISVHYPIGSQYYEYDKNGSQTKETDALGRVTSFEYDVIGQLTKTIYADGSNTQQSYDENGNMVSSTNEENETNSYTFDALDQLTTFTNAENEITTYSYDGLGNLKTISTPTGNVVHYVYDNESRLYSTYDELGRISKTTYDPAGNILTERDGNDIHWVHDYDALNRIVVSTDPKNDFSLYSFDANNNPIQTTDREDNLTQQSYDALNRMISQTDALGNITTYNYDEVDNLINITDAKGNVTSYEYDGNNRLTKEIFADGTNKIYDYDAVGNIKSRTDNSGTVTTYTYDERNRLILRNYPGNNDDSFDYDGVGRMTYASNSQASLLFNFDNTGRLLSENLNGHTTSYTYNVANRERTINYSAGNHIVVETIDKRGRLKQIKRNGIVMANWYYDSGNRKMSRTYNNGSKSHFDYNSSNWITSLKHVNANSNFVHLNYGYDNEGNKKYEEKLHRPNRSESYTYDENYRLIDFQRGNLGTSNFPNQTIFSYDPLGNRENVDVNNALKAYQSNAMNEYTSITGMADPVYDANGNLIDDGNYTYQYDFENRIISVDGGTTATYVYDPFGRRISKTTVSGTTNYFYDGQRVIVEKNGSGIQTAHYIYGTWIDDILVKQRDGNDYYYHKNALGSVAAISNSSGNPIEFYEYDAYGKTTIYNSNYNELSTTNFGNPYLFTGRRLDVETGLFYYRARHYDTEQGRFLQRDPLGYVDGMNMYQYVSNNPFRYIDPKGTKKWVLKDQTATPATDNWSVKTESGTAWDPFNDLSKMTGEYDITPTKSGGTASVSNVYLHDRSIFLFTKRYEVGAKWNRKYQCNQTTGNLEYVDGEGPKANPLFNHGISYAHMKVQITGEGTKKVHITVDVKTGASASVTVETGLEIEVGVGGHEGGPSGKITLGTSISWTGSAGAQKGTTKDWFVECICVD